ncbi:putative leader peptide [Actinomycetospora lemnae]|uniref:putative leader peptide n=1 Tax=Actinomycetospora lemnae TaxID=3019891 RepID=UPI0038CBF70D
MHVHPERPRAEPGQRGGRQRAVRGRGLAGGGNGGHAPILRSTTTRPRTPAPTGAIPLGRRSPRHRSGWRRRDADGTVDDVPALRLLLVTRRHVDLGRLASALCPAC